MELGNLVNTDRGFVHTGTFRVDPAEHPITPFELVEIDGPLPATPGVYLFVVKGLVKYAGSAKLSLRQRVKSYLRRISSVEGGRLVHRELRGAVLQGEVEVYTLCIAPEHTHAPWGAFQLSTLLGLEAWIIDAFDLRDEWNVR